MTTSIAKTNSLPLFTIMLLLTVVFYACDKDDPEPEPTHPYNGKTLAEFNPDLTYGLLTDQEGNEYKTIKIGEQTWMAENLRTTVYRNGDSIPNITGREWYDMESGAYCNYYGITTEEFIATYGRLYNWYAVIDERNIAPDGWHVPSRAEWEELETYLTNNGYIYDGSNDKRKVGKALASTNIWKESDKEGTVGNADYPEFRNLSGFTAVPGGRGYSGLDRFEDYVYGGFWWCIRNNNLQIHAYVYILYDNTKLLFNARPGNFGLSIRCIKNK